MAKNKSHKSSASARQSSNPMSKLKKDPGVPKLNLKQKQVEKISARIARLAGVTTDAMHVDSSPSIAGLAASTRLKKDLEEDIIANDESTPYLRISSDPTLAAHAYQFKKVLETADVILQVLDARDPLGCRSKIVEEEVLRSGGDKKIILVMNKTDLAPKENVQAWLKYLRHDFPTIPFKSSTQQQRNNLSSSTSSKSSSKGAPHLLHLLKSIRPSHSSITVGVLGPPNVGKSSLINSIKREKVCTVGAKPGETRALKEVSVERGIKVIDSPGIVWGDAKDDGSGTATLRNVWSLEGLEDPVMVVEGIVSRVPAETLQQMYATPPFKDASELLMMIALVRGKLGKGGKPDINLAALAVVHDWNVGKIPFFTVPPAIHPSMVPRDQPPIEAADGEDAIVTDDTARAAAFASTSIVKEWGKAFDLDGLWAAADDDVLGDGTGDDNEDEMQVEEDVEAGDELRPMDDGASVIEDDSRPVTAILKRPASRASTIQTQSHSSIKERRPPKRPRERTQRLAPKGVDEELGALSVSLNRKKQKDEAKRKRREGREERVGGEDIDMGE